MSRSVMGRPRKKDTGRPLERVPLRKLMRSIRQDIRKKLAETEQVEVRKPRET